MGGATTQDERYGLAAETYGPALERLARAYEADPDRRLDLLQDIHVALWRSLGRFDGRCALRTWVYRVAHNVGASHIVKQRSHFAPLTTLEGIEVTAGGESPEQSAGERQALGRLMAMVRRLKPPDRQVMLLYLEDVEAAAIAEVTGLSARAVATRIHRAKALLARDFPEETRVSEDPKRLWQDQPKEDPDMGLEQVKIRLRRYEARALWQRVMIVAVGVAAIAIMAAVATQPLEPGAMVGAALLLGGIVGVMVLGWRRLSPKPPSDDAAACVAFLRERLLDRRRLARGGWGWMLVLLLPGIAVRYATLAQEAGPLWLSRMALLVGVFLLWLVVMLLTQRRAARLVDRELAELDRLGLG